MSPLEEFAAVFYTAQEQFHILRPVQTIKSSLNRIEIIPGQWILCTDTKEYYNDIANGVRIKVSDTIMLDTESDRESTIPINGKFYFIKENGFFYSYVNDEWSTIKTTASSVITEDGSTVEDKLKTISKIGRTVSYVDVETDKQVEFDIPFPFDNYFELGNFMEIRVGSVYVDERRYTINGSKLTFDDSMNLISGRSVTFVFWYNSYTDSNYLPQISNIPANRIVLSNGQTVEEAMATLLASK